MDKTLAERLRETRFLPCPECDGYGAHVTGRGQWPDGSERNEEHPCPTCSGEGQAEQEVWPVECEEPEFAS